MNKYLKIEEYVNDSSINQIEKILNDSYEISIDYFDIKRISNKNEKKIDIMMFNNEEYNKFIKKDSKIFRKIKLITIILYLKENNLKIINKYITNLLSMCNENIELNYSIKIEEPIDRIVIVY